MLGILLKVLAFHLNFLIYTGCANNNMIRSEDVLFLLVFANRMKARLKNEENTEFWQISCARVICTKEVTQHACHIQQFSPNFCAEKFESFALCTELAIFCKMSADNTSPLERGKFC